MMKLKKRTFLILMAALTATFASAQKQPLPEWQEFSCFIHRQLKTDFKICVKREFPFFSFFFVCPYAILYL